MNKIKTIAVHVLLIYCVVLSVHNKTFAQRERTSSVGYGAAIVYNFQTQGFGVDVRARIHLWNSLYVVPEISYYPPFDNYHELYAGAALQYDVVSIGSYNFYIAGGGYYNMWFNSEDVAPTRKNENNLVPEAGAGFVRNHGCIRPFIEGRYDFKWKEETARIGIYWYPGSCGGGRREKCPPRPQ